MTADTTLSREQTQDYIAEHGGNVENGMEYLQGLETQNGEYLLSDIIRFINR